MTIFKKHKCRKQLKDLGDKSKYATQKMKEHEQDEDSTEWKKWAVLNTVYLGEMVKLRAQLDGIEV